MPRPYMALAGERFFAPTSYFSLLPANFLTTYGDYRKLLSSLFSSVNLSMEDMHR